jgi:hypothetical protein
MFHIEELSLFIHTELRREYVQMWQKLSMLMNSSTKILLMAPSQSTRVLDICLRMGHDW